MGCRIACTGSGAQGFLRPNADQADRGRRSTGHADAFWQASGALYRWLFRLVGDEPLAEDLLSEVFLDVWRQAASFEARSSVSTWLLAIAPTRHSQRGAAGPTRN
jgi:DNA-directed RNA polymerase specialized sigma24 family protein